MPKGKKGRGKTGLQQARNSQISVIECMCVQNNP